METRGLLFMSNTARRFSCANAQLQPVVTKDVTYRLVTFFMMGLLILQSPCGFAGEASAKEIKQAPSSLYKDVFDSNVFYDNTSLLRFDRLSRKITGHKLHAADVNIYDEVPDSAFFTNRQGRKPLSNDELAKGYHETEGPDLSGSLTITGGHLQGLRPVFTVTDSKGDEYTINFDTSDSLGLMTGAMVIASRVYYAAGYNVPQVTLHSFAPAKLVPGANAKFVDSSGFAKKLTKEKLDELVLMVPWAEDGNFTAAAVKTPAGIDKGPFGFQGRRKDDPADTIPHELRRELRALSVVAAWLNDFSVHDQNTRSYQVTENGKTYLKHYLFGFMGALGSDMDGAKPPMVGYEYLYDAQETAKAFWTLGILEKPWQKRWREANQTTGAPAVGYFDNNGFAPSKFKTFLPQYAFKDLTRADAFWAAKILKSFSDENIHAIVKAGKYTDEKDEALITDTLIARRDLVARYWMMRSAPLDDFDVKGNQLTFTDLSAKYGFEKDSAYEAEVSTVEGKKRKKVTALRSDNPSFTLEPSWLQSGVELHIRKVRPGITPNPYVLVRISGKGIEEIIHQD